MPMLPTCISRMNTIPIKILVANPSFALYPLFVTIHYASRCPSSSALDKSKPTIYHTYLTIPSHSLLPPPPPWQFCEPPSKIHPL